MSSIATTSAMAVTRRRPWAQAAAFLVCGTLLFVPLIIFLVNEGSYLQTAHEALAYRYFFPYRLASGEQGHLWTPQGWTTVVLQRVIFAVQGLFIAPEAQLRQSMELFGVLTTVVQSGCGLLLLTVTFRDRSLHGVAKTAVVLALLIPLFCTATGQYYWMLPDYYQLNMVLVAGLVYCFSKADGIASGRFWLSGALLLGAYFGIVVANKVSLALSCLIAVIPMVLGTTGWKRIVAVLLACLGGAAAGVTLTILLVYLPHWSLIGPAIAPWLAYLRAPGPEPAMAFWMSFVQTYLIPNNYHVVGLLYVATWVAVLVLLAAFLGWRSKEFQRSVALTLLGLSAPLVLVARQTGTTVFEVFLTLTAVTMAQVALLATLEGDTRPGWVLGRALAGVVVLYCGVVTVAALPWLRMADAAARSHGRAEVVWGLSDSVRALRAPVIVVTPDNNHIFGTPEEAVLRGFSDFPTWTISTGKRGIDRIYPAGLSFRTLGDAFNHPAAPYPPGSIIMWFDVVHPDVRLLPEEYPALQEAVSRPTMSCRLWPDPGNQYVRATLCAPAAGGGT